MEKRMTDNELDELLESWINGNRSFVREQVTGNPDARARLALRIADGDSKEQARKFLDGF